MPEETNDFASPRSPDGSARRRRPRYPGTHPRRFEQRYKELEPGACSDIHEHVRAQGRTPAGTHIPVMVDEVLRTLAPEPGAIVADCTIGYGGHAEAFLKKIAPGGRLIGLDVDGVQLDRTRERLWTAAQAEACGSGGDAAGRVSLHRSHFAGLPKVLARDGLSCVDVVFADLGVSSMQLDDPSRGFSYKVDGPLDMRMDDRSPMTAADLIAALSEAELATALREYGDEPHHDRIARAVVARRDSEPVRRTMQLVRIIFESTGTSRQRWREQVADGVHPAARTFQALRILVNEEMSGLDQFLRVVPHCLSPGGRIGIISFHSGEDRRVKHVFRDGFRSGFFYAIAEDVIRPVADEVGSNPRSRSARFRWARRAAG